MMYVSGRGDGSLGTIREVEADYETTMRHTSMQSEIGRKSVASGLNFSNGEGGNDVSQATLKTQCKYFCK